MCYLLIIFRTRVVLCGPLLRSLYVLITTCHGQICSAALDAVSIMLLKLPVFQGWQYGTVRYASTVRYAPFFGKKYGTLVRYVIIAKVRVRYVGTCYKYAY